MPDIASKLFPNVTTIIIQLLSTGVLLLSLKSIYGFLYKTILQNEQNLLKEL